MADSRRLHQTRVILQARYRARLPPTEGWDLAWDGEEPAPKLAERKAHALEAGVDVCIAANGRER